MTISPRSGFAVVFACCAGLLGFALYQQYQAFLDPCPLCVFQRAGFMYMALIALLATVHNPGRIGIRVYGALTAVGAAFGAAVALRHLWLQHLPAEQVPECGPGLNYMLDTLPLTEAFSRVLLGSGSCAEVHWRFLGLSMPGWTLLWFATLGAGILWTSYRKT